MIFRQLCIKTFVLAFAAVKAFNPYLNPVQYQGIYSSPSKMILGKYSATGSQTISPEEGILKVLSSQLELDYHCSFTTLSKYVVILPYKLLNNQNLFKMKTHGSLSGIILIINSTLNGNEIRPTSFSPGSQCQNCEFGLYKNDKYQHRWDPMALDLNSISFDFPIFSSSSENFYSNYSLVNIITAAKENERREFQFPLYSIQLETFHKGSTNSETCLRNKFCQPVGGLSVWSSFTNISVEKTKKIIVLTSQIDGNSFIKGEGKGKSLITGMVAMMAIADALANSKDLKKTFLFNFFSGEQYGYAGSKRFVKDINSNFVCKSTEPNPRCKTWTKSCTDPCIYDTDFSLIDPNLIEGIVDFSTLLSLWTSPSTPDEERNNFFAHIDDEANTGSMNLKTLFLSKPVVSSGKGEIYPGVLSPFLENEINLKLPPSSLQSFLIQNRSIPGVSITDFKKTVNNLYYNSEFDDGSSLTYYHASKLCGIVDQVAKNLWKWANVDVDIDSNEFGESAKNIVVPSNVGGNCSLVTELLDCFTRNISCSYTQKYYSAGGLTSFPNFPGGFSFDVAPSFTAFVLYWYMFNVTSTNQSDNPDCSLDTDCDSTHYCLFKKCVNSQTRYHYSYGTGLEYNVGTGKFEVVDNDNPLFTVSTVKFARGRIYLAPSLTYIIAVLVFGIIISLSTLITGKFFQRKYQKVHVE